MIIGVDARLLERPMTGVGRYLENILQGISEVDHDSEYLLYTQRPLEKKFSGKFRNVVVPNTLLYGFPKLRSAFWYHIILPRVLQQDLIDVFFAPNGILPIRRTGARNVVTIHDVFQMIDAKFHPWIFRLYTSFFLHRTARQADSVIAISEASKRDIMRFLRIPEKKIRVIYEAADRQFIPRDITGAEQSRLREKYNLPGKFILHVGVVEERKNISGLLAIADGLQGKTNAPLVLVGRVGYRGDIYLKEIKKHINMRYLSFVEESDLPMLYNLASVFVFPSRYEGFGLPPLEAMQSGTPVITSNTSSLPEVVGDGGILLPPDDIHGFVSAITEVIGGLDTHIIPRGIAQAGKFSWEKAAKETVEVFRGN